MMMMEFISVISSHGGELSVLYKTQGPKLQFI